MSEWFLAYLFNIQYSSNNGRQLLVEFSCTSSSYDDSYDGSYAYIALLYTIQVSNAYIRGNITSCYI